MNDMRRLSIIALAGVALLAGCSGHRNLTSASATTSTGTGTNTGTGTATTTVFIGSGTPGANFQTGDIAISTPALSAAGSTTLQVSLEDQTTGTLYTTSTVITFTSPCETEGKATIVATPASGSTPASSSVTTTTGTATATYTSNGCVGSDLITASASVAGQTLKALGTVTIAQAAAGAIKFLSATPANIALKGVGSAGGSATSTVIFKVLDGSGAPRAGAAATFALNTTVGGISIAPATAVTDANGEVQTTVSSGTVATTVRVSGTTTATGGAKISTESGALTTGW